MLPFVIFARDKRKQQRGGELRNGFRPFQTRQSELLQVLNTNCIEPDPNLRFLEPFWALFQLWVKSLFYFAVC